MEESVVRLLEKCSFFRPFALCYHRLLSSPFLTFLQFHFLSTQSVEIEHFSSLRSVRRQRRQPTLGLCRVRLAEDGRTVFSTECPPAGLRWPRWCATRSAQPKNWRTVKSALEIAHKIVAAAAASQLYGRPAVLLSHFVPFPLALHLPRPPLFFLLLRGNKSVIRRRRRRACIK